MAAEKDLIVAIELGSSAIRGIIGKKNADGSIQVLNIEQETTADCIQKGVIYNLDKTILSLNQIIERLQEKQGVYINKVYIGIGGQSLHTVRNCVSRQLETKEVITAELVDNLMDTNLNVNYPDSEILDVVPQEYRVDNSSTNEPAGILSDNIEGRFLNVIARSILKEKIQRCIRSTGREVAEYHISSLALADALLTDAEKRSGCALVDFGAETTTIAIYTDNKLRHLAVIPLGSKNITHDIASKKIELDEAEELKLKYGAALSDPNESEDNRPINISNGRKLESNVLQEIIEARMAEIIDNVWEQINNKYSDKPMAGIIFTGSAANIKNLDKAFIRRTGYEKLKIGRVVPCNTKSGSVEERLIKDGRMNTLLALLTKGELSCIGSTPVVEEEKASEEVIEITPTPPVEKPQETPSTDKEEPKPNVPPKPSSFSRMGRAVKDFFTKIVEED